MILVGRQKRSQSDTLLCEHNAVGSRNLILYQDKLNTEAVQAGPKKCTTNTRLSFSSKLQADLETLQNLNFLGQVKIGLRLDKIRRHQSFFPSCMEVSIYHCAKWLQTQSKLSASFVSLALLVYLFKNRLSGVQLSLLQSAYFISCA